MTGQVEAKINRESVQLCRFGAIRDIPRTFSAGHPRPRRSPHRSDRNRSLLHTVLATTFPPPTNLISDADLNHPILSTPSAPLAQRSSGHRARKARASLPGTAWEKSGAAIHLPQNSETTMTIIATHEIVVRRASKIRIHGTTNGGRK
jgi:hypothetical protein